MLPYKYSIAGVIELSLKNRHNMYSLCLIYGNITDPYSLLRRIYSSLYVKHLDSMTLMISFKHKDSEQLVGGLYMNCIIYTQFKMD